MPRVVLPLLALHAAFARDALAAPVASLPAQALTDIVGVYRLARRSTIHSSLEQSTMFTPVRSTAATERCREPGALAF